MFDPRLHAGLSCMRASKPGGRSLSLPIHRVLPGSVRGTLRSGYDPSVTLGSLSMALLRLNYRLARIPLQLVEDVGIALLDERAPTRLAYEQLLITCDSAAAILLGDEYAAARAADMRRRNAGVRVTIARRHQRVDAESAALLDLQRERFERRRHQGHRPSLTYLS